MLGGDSQPRHRGGNDSHLAAHEPQDAAGRLFYLMGASGAGKDSLMGYARRALGEAGDVLFAHRYITRPAGSGGENHVELSDAEFALRRRRGLFLFDWEGNGCRYGVGVEVSHWLERGLHVVVNGSRAYLPEARRRLPVLVPVLVRVSAHRLAERLHGRGREQASDVEQRLQRSRRYGDVDAPGLVVIDNDGELAEAGESLLALLRSHAPGAGVTSRG